MSNPLLDFTDLPLFDRIRAEHVAPAVDALLTECEQALETAVAPGFPAQWQALAATLDTATEKLSLIPTCRSRPSYRFPSLRRWRTPDHNTMSNRNAPPQS